MPNMEGAPKPDDIVAPGDETGVMDAVSAEDAEKLKADAQREVRMQRGAEFLGDVATEVGSSYNKFTKWVGKGASDLWGGFQRLLPKTFEGASVGIGRALEATDKAVAVANREIGGTQFVAKLAYTEAQAVGRKIWESKAAKFTGKTLKYAGIGVGGAAALPFALMAAPFLGPIAAAKRPAEYEAARQSMRDAGRLGEYGAANVTEVPGMLIKDASKNIAKAYNGVTGWMKKQWDKAGVAKDALLKQLNDRRLAKMEKAGMATSRQVQALMDQNAQLLAMLEALQKSKTEGSADASAEPKTPDYDVN